MKILVYWLWLASWFYHAQVFNFHYVRSFHFHIMFLCLRVGWGCSRSCLILASSSVVSLPVIPRWADWFSCQYWFWTNGKHFKIVFLILVQLVLAGTWDGLEDRLFKSIKTTMLNLYILIIASKSEWVKYLSEGLHSESHLAQWRPLTL